MITTSLLSNREKIRKIWRYSRIYSVRFAINKVIARLRPISFFVRKFYLYENRFISLVGCGQFQFSVIAYYLGQTTTNRFLSCYDVNLERANSLAHYYGAKYVGEDINDVLSDQDTKLIYIASNHKSHAPYAIAALQQGIDVFIEKPVAVNFEQFEALFNVIEQGGRKVYVGFNRPFAPAIQKLKATHAISAAKEGAFSMNFFIAGHNIPLGHWYRKPGEGNRVTSNICHWIDLMVHCFYWRDTLPEMLVINLAYAQDKEDNFSIAISSDRGDMISIQFSVREEPFEGVYESIDIHTGNILCKINDFRSMVLLEGSKLYEKKYKQKDVGHQQCINQPFSKAERRVGEIKLSTYLTLFIAKMIQEQNHMAQLPLETVFSTNSRHLVSPFKVANAYSKEQKEFNKEMSPTCS